MFIGDWLARREMLTPNKVALIDAQRDYQPITYRAWNRAANQTANFLRELGVHCKALSPQLPNLISPYLRAVWDACVQGGLG